MRGEMQGVRGGGCGTRALFWGECGGAEAMVDKPEADELVCCKKCVQEEARDGEALAVKLPKVLPHVLATHDVHAGRDCGWRRGHTPGERSTKH